MKTIALYNPITWNTTVDKIAYDCGIYNVLYVIAKKHGEYSRQFSNLISEFEYICSSYPTYHPVFIKTVDKLKRRWLRRRSVFIPFKGMNHTRKLFI